MSIFRREVAKMEKSTLTARESFMSETQETNFDKAVEDLVKAKTVGERNVR